MKRIGPLSLLAVLLAFFWSTTGPVPRAAAFDNEWTFAIAHRVADGEHGLWDDMPSAGFRNNEAALLWFVNNDLESEDVAYETTEVTINSNIYPLLVARADISDWGIFYVGYDTSGTGSCDYPAALQWGLSDGPRGYLVKSSTLPPDLIIRKICVWLYDQNASIATGRSSVLIDYIRLQTPQGAVGWEEGFDGTP